MLVFVDRAELTVEVVEGRRVSWLGHLVRSVLSRGLYDSWRLMDKKHVYRPQVIVRNRRGETQRLFPADSYAEAITKRDRLRTEMSTTSLDVWCDRYNVPAVFVNPDDPWRKPPTE